MDSAIDPLIDICRDRIVLLCTTSDVYTLYGQAVESAFATAKRVVTVIVDTPESAKDIDAVLAVCEHAQRAEIGRRDLFVALGGGVCSDIVRVAASLVRRGIGHVCIPTTLIGQIDAAIGVKGGVNFNGAKSFLGAFHPPEAVFIDSRFLRTQPASALRDGLAEAIKLAVSMDADLFELIERHGAALVESGFADPAEAGQMLLRRSIALTVTQLAEDLYESGSLRRVLDFGHTFSPLIEAYSGFAISHGAAVAIDICLSAAIAAEMGHLTPESASRIVAAVDAIGLPTDSVHLDPSMMRESLRCAARHRGGAPNLVIPDGVGSSRFVTDEAALPDKLLDRSLRRLREECADACATIPLQGALG